jgi:hypothetical protein
VDNVLRGGRLLLALAAVGACRVDPGPAVGVSSPRGVTEPPSPRPVDASVAVPSPVAADFREHMTRVSERSVSHGHADRFDGVVWTNEAARAGWNGPGEMADGAMLVEEAVEKTVKGDRPAGLLVMEKRAGTWRFVVVDAAGHVVEWSRAEACVGCHRDAPRDFVFHLDAAAAPAPAASK